MPKVYSKDDVIEMQKEFAQDLKEIHILESNILDKYTRGGNVKLDLIKLMRITYDKKTIIKKDINIETSSVESKRFQ